MNAASPLPSAELIEQALKRLPDSHQKAAQNLLTQILHDLKGSLSSALWCDAQGLEALFTLFNTPLVNDNGGVKLHIGRHAGVRDDDETNASPCAQGGTRIIIHLHDTPYILDAVRNFLKQSGLSLFAQAHTTLLVKRNAKGHLVNVATQKVKNTDAYTREMVILMLTEEILEPEAFDTLRVNLQAVLDWVKLSVDDFPQMVARIEQEAERLEGESHDVEAQFLRWVEDGNFVFMGARMLLGHGGQLRNHPHEAPLGVYRSAQVDALLARVMPGMREEIDAILDNITQQPPQKDDGATLTIDYCEHGQSVIYNAEGADFFLLKRPHTLKDGELTWKVFIGLGRFSRASLASRASTVPVLNIRLKETLALSGFEPGSYLHHEFRNLYDRMPLRELFYSNPEVITEQIREILEMEGENDVRVLARMGRFENYVSVITAVSKNRFYSRLTDKVKTILSRHMEYPVSTVSVSETGSTFFIVCYANHTPGKPFSFHRAMLEAQIRREVMTWEDKLREELLHSLPPRAAHRRFNRYANAFEPVFKEAAPAPQAARDIDVIESLTPRKRFASRVAHYENGGVYIKLYTDDPVELTRMVRTFDNFGVACLHEFSTQVRLENDKTITIQRFEVGGPSRDREQLTNRAELFSQALDAIHDGRMLDDALIQLVLLEGFEPKEILLMQGVRQYLLQIRRELSAAKVNQVLIVHHKLARLILEAFLCRFDTGGKRSKKLMCDTAKRFEEGLQEVVNLQDDQVLRGLHNVVESMLRTSYFREDCEQRISFKIDSAAISEMPSPRPWREIFVITPTLEGVHLRGGRVARGGLRFSDRHDDFRTEVLGLMKTQMVKNAIIVPVGSKGGFIIPRIGEITPSHRMAYVEAQYKDFIRGLLDITDNRVEGGIAHPPDVMILDEEDPYLVVAADKGTATFSDIANGIAEEEYGFWMGDGFASGGTHGYDHKKVGITARGAWECIRLHFHELGHDIYTDPFTVVGIGDMSGDVFGNGLLSSRQIKLVGAFNHLHVFLDPDPDTESSFAERERLFKMGRSSWSDYDVSLISKGGGVFNRSAKAIPLNDTLRKLLDTKAESLSGEQVIQRLLTARVDLLYNGGIGTYVKAHTESQLDVSDKANDSVRVDASQLKCRIVGEGGNLGLTQRARLEFAVNKGRVNTDALDNSGGVDLSDHEVNLKILFAHLLQVGELDSIDSRNTLLSKLTEEVANMVLADNRMQHMAISRDEILSSQSPEIFLDGLDMLHELAGLNFVDENVPSREALVEILDDGPMPRPLLAIMLGYAKLYAYTRLLDSELVDMFFFERYLVSYFPASVSRDYGKELSEHFLKREIIATCITNRVINQTGVGPLLATFNKVRRARPDGNPLSDLFKAYLIAENMVDAPSFRHDVHALGVNVKAPIKYQVLADMESVLLHLAAWMLTHLSNDRITIDVINLYGKVILAFQRNLWESLPQLLSAERVNELDKRRKQLEKMGLSEKLAKQTVLLPYLKDAMTILHLKESLHVHFEPVGHLYIQVDDFFGISWIEESLQKVRNRDVWGRLNLENVRKELWETRTRLVKRIITFKRHNESVAEAFANYLQEVESQVEEYQALMTQLREQQLQDLLPLSVLVRKLRDLLLIGQEES
ncbi:NAD-glutamate dehydrogenase domain-containing protein [Magnetofaba australis]|nr:NAD-glutamate dehydrogenase domain-containing protein [Magnetofaba australis]